MDGFDQAKAVFASSVTIGGVDVKITVFYWLALVAVATWVLLRTKFGNWIFAVGGDANAARAVGVPVKFTKIALFMGVGFAAGSSACTTCSRSTPCSPVRASATSSSTSSPRSSAAACSPAATARRSAAAIGAFIFGMANKGIVYANWNPDWFKFFLGVMLLLATIVNLLVKRRAEPK